MLQPLTRIDWRLVRLFSLLCGLALLACTSSGEKSQQQAAKQAAKVDSAATQPAQPPTTKERLARRWVLHNLAVPAEVPKHQERLVATLAEQMTAHHRLLLRPDGRFRRQDPGLGIGEPPIQHEGRWRYDTTESRLLLHNAEGYADTLQLLRVNEDELIMRSEGPDGTFPQRLSYKPAASAEGPPS